MKHQHLIIAALCLFSGAATAQTSPSGIGCRGDTDRHISCFTSLAPREQDDTVHLPPSHAFQILFAEEQPYTKGREPAPGAIDFTGYLGLNGSSRRGYLTVNHETQPKGQVSVLDIHLNDDKGLWAIDTSQGIDFSGLGGLTRRNCSGTVTPWKTVISCEEDYGLSSDAGKASDTDGDGYLDIGWCLEIDPAKRRVVDYGTGKPQKLWAMGRIRHENVTIAADRRTAYFGEDEDDGSVYKFVADQPGNLSSGELFVLRLDLAKGGGEPRSGNGTWIRVPNSTKQERNGTKALALKLGATTFHYIEDVEVNPLNGLVYFTASEEGRVYRFADKGQTAENFETFVGGKSYKLQTAEGSVPEEWGVGNDNLAFDDRGNLYVLQDGARNYIWFVAADHTQAEPKVSLFMETPVDCEPTGMTFTPDYRYMFMSIKGPHGSTPQTDIGGRTEVYDKDILLVVARREFLGRKQLTTAVTDPASAEPVRIFPNPAKNGRFSVALTLQHPEKLRVEMIGTDGRPAALLADGLFLAGNHLFTPAEGAPGIVPGLYFIRLMTSRGVTVEKLVIP